MIEYWLPSPSLRHYVRQLQLIRFDFSNASVIPFKPYWPRPENCLTFYPRDLETVAYAGQAKRQAKPKSVLVGQPTILTNRYMNRDFLILQVVFQPGALFRLTGLPIHELTDTFIDAEAIFPVEIRLVNERLNSTDNYQEMISILEGFLHYLIRKAKKDSLPIDRVSLLMLNVAQSPVSSSQSVDWLAKEACLSPKQFYRKSMERFGISPKLFERIVRFNEATKLKDAHPAKDWLSIAVEAGYYDYQHLVRDFREFTTMAPNEFLQHDNQALKCSFGIVAT